MFRFLVFGLLGRAPANRWRRWNEFLGWVAFGRVSASADTTKTNRASPFVLDERLARSRIFENVMESIEYWPAALSHLSGADPVMKGLIERVSGVELQPDRFGSHFEAIVRAIIFQQISGHAGRSIFKKFSGLFPDGHPVPSMLRTKTPDELRAVGVSPQKAGYLIDLACKCDDRLVHVEKLHELPDAQIIEELTSVKGIGVWTAQMFLIFQLARPDVLPDLDLGIRKGIQQAHGLPELPTSPQVQEIGACWAPYRTVASLYLWRSMDVQTPA